MEAAYHRDPYRRSLDTVIVAAGADDGDPWAILEDTILYPEGGGQPADRGSVNGIAVLDVQAAPDGVRHVLAEPAEPGPAFVELHWQRRWDHMQQHTGQHLLTAIADREFGLPTTAFHLGDEVADIELGADSIEPGDLINLEDRVNAEILAARPVTARIVDRSEFAALPVRSRRMPDDLGDRIRLIDIEGLDLNTCGGTHVRSTAEIGTLNLIGTERLRGGTRVFFVAGDRARRRLRDHEMRNHELRTLLGAADRDFVATVSTRLAKEQELGRQVRRLLRDLTEAEVRVLTGRGNPLVAHWPDRDMNFLVGVGRELADRDAARWALLSAGPDEAGFFVIVVAESAVDNARGRVAGVLEILGGRGGGKGRILQGKALRLDRRDEAAARFVDLV